MRAAVLCTLAYSAMACCLFVVCCYAGGLAGAAISGRWSHATTLSVDEHNSQLMLSRLRGSPPRGRRPRTASSSLDGKTTGNRTSAGFALLESMSKESFGVSLRGRAGKAVLTAVPNKALQRILDKKESGIQMSRRGACRSAECCAIGLYNLGWDGYRLGDMLQSRYQRHTRAGANYHLKQFPQSIVAKFLLHYKAPRSRSEVTKAADTTSRFDQVTRGTCHPGHNTSAFPLNTSTCGKADIPLHLQCCSYVLPQPALIDILAQERAETPIAPRTAAVHVRGGRGDRFVSL